MTAEEHAEEQHQTEPAPEPGAGPEALAADEAAADSVEEDLDELAALAAERDEYLTLAQRTKADFENYRRRSAREGAAAEQRGVARLARELLPALDNLERALSAAPADEDVAHGLRLVQAELAAALQRCGIEAFAPDGEPFDPQHHEAMVQQPVEGVESGTVVEVYQRGYRHAGVVLRPARVVVAA